MQYQMETWSLNRGSWLLVWVVVLGLQAGLMAVSAATDLSYLGGVGYPLSDQQRGRFAEELEGSF
jgi:hypothetical protein